MQIKHKLTGEVTEIDFEIWLEEYIPKKLDTNYDILIKDTVFVREILDSGERRYLNERERSNAIKLVTSYPNQFEFVEEYIKVDNTTIRFEATYNMEYDSFKLMFAEHLKDKLDDAYFLVTGKFPPTNNKALINSGQLRLPLLNLSNDEKKYLQEIYSRFVIHEDENLKPYTLVAKLWKYPPTNFSPENIPPILLNRGIEITPLGIYQINPKSKLLILVENTLHLLRDTIHKNEGVEEISNKTVLDAFPGTKFNDIYLAFKLIYRLGSFSTGMSHSTNVASLRIDSDAVFKNILGFNSLAHYYRTVGFKTNINSINGSNDDFQLNELATKDNSNPISLDEVKRRVINLEVSSRFIISENVEGVIGVAEQAQEIAQLLIDLNTEPGMMIGIFGRWGRGKTFFWKQIKAYFDKLEIKPFQYVEFHAWKYQDTPASWAYLYESISKSLIENSKKHWLFRIPKNVLRLNILKNGLFPIVLFIIPIIATTILVFVPYETKWQFIKWIFGFSSATIIYFLYKFYSKHIPSAKELFRQYSSITSFKNLLGLQSEIQNELRQLLQASLTNSNNKILLFVDDLDRCTESRIVEIIDSLKVMLEDDIISKHIIVLTAVDERVLKRAIIHKYYDSINRNFIEKTERKKVMETLVREYMDKLFISGIKLTNLNLREKEDIFDAFSKNQNKVNFKKTDNSVEEGEIIDHPESVPSNINNISQYIAIENPLTNEDIIELEHGNPDYEIEEFEYNYLKFLLKHHIDATPRSIRIYYYRYLLAKKFLIHKLPLRSELNHVWNILDDKKILPELIVFYSTVQNLDDLNVKLKQIESSEDSDIDLDLFQKYSSLNKLLVIELIKVVEIVIAY